jgi:adenylate kinase
MDRVILLRCHPKILRKRLEKKAWAVEKITENVDAETLDVILCEAVEHHHENNIFEIETTSRTINEVAACVEEIITQDFAPVLKYKIGQIDWSEEILKE